VLADCYWLMENAHRAETLHLVSVDPLLNRRQGPGDHRLGETGFDGRAEDLWDV
jgi:hypothetical protein